MNDLNVRDLFAVVALVGMIIRTPSDEWADDYVVDSAYELANAMMEEKERQDAKPSS